MIRDTIWAEPRAASLFSRRPRFLRRIRCSPAAQPQTSPNAVERTGSANSFGREPLWYAAPSEQLEQHDVGSPTVFTAPGSTLAPVTQAKEIAVNRQAFHNYAIIEKFEAGHEATGTEIKSRDAT